MKHLFVFGLVVTLLSCTTSKEKGNHSTAINYPVTPTVDSIDVYFGDTITDNFRWLEDDTAAATLSWTAKQNELTNSYLDKIPFRDSIKTRLTQLWNFEKYSAPFKIADQYYYYKNDGIQNQSVLYTQSTPDAEASVFLDPNQLSKDGTVAMSGINFTDDGKYLAYMTSAAGSDWKTIHIMDVENKKMLDEKIEWVKFSGSSWWKDGFFYSRYDAPEAGNEYKASNKFHKVYYHKVGTTQAEDALIYFDKENPQRTHYAYTTEDEKYLILTASKSTSGSLLMIKDLTDPSAEFQTIVGEFGASYGVIRHKDNKLLVTTNFEAPKYRVIEIDLANPARENWKDIIPEGEHVLQNISLANNQMIVKYLEQVKSAIYRYDFEGNRIDQLKLPGIGIASGFTAEKDDTVAYYSFVNFTHPAYIYKYDFKSNTSTLYKKPEIDFQADDYETKQVFYKSKDGTEVPMFITHKKGIKYDGTNPLFLFGYGGFNISYQPEFRLDRTIFLENGGIYAVANIRGGGELGKKWHKAGTKQQKQNVFDDFIAAAEYLIANKYTSAEKFAVHGRSNGGLLAGAMLTQRPDLFKVVLPKVGVLDMLRYHKFTIGWAWAGDYGRSDDSEEMYKYLRAYSPYHNVKKQAYPATMVITGDHDDRVLPAHSFKFAAELQRNQTGDAPMLIRIDKDAGHGSGKPVSKQIDEFTDTWAFVFHHLGMKVK